MVRTSNLLAHQVRGLHFKHTDNINFWITTMQSVGLPKVIIRYIFMVMSLFNYICVLTLQTVLLVTLFCVDILSHHNRHL